MKTYLSLFAALVLPFFLTAQTITYDFEDGDLSLWGQFPADRWTLTTTNPIGGIQSLKHALASGAGTDRISVELPSWNEDQGDITWWFKLRHGWNPAATNHWAVFISCDKDAQGMIAAENPNGYAVGVNLTGSDDLLRLYRVDNGSYTPIITSAVNWETQIGRTTAGAVEVERKADGTFTLRVSVDGDYGTLQNEGSVVDLAHPLGNYFGIYFLYTTSAAGLLTADDISFSYTPQNINNHDAIVSAPEAQIVGGVISSLAVTPAQAVDIFRFKITDPGTSDGLPTHVTRMRFSSVASPMAANLSEAVGGIALKGASGTIPIESLSISSSTIDVELDPQSLVVADGSSAEFTLSLYLTTEGVVNQSIIQLVVSAQNHGWTAHHEGSGFAQEFPAQVLSNPFAIEVLGTHLHFTQYPQTLSLNEPFDVEAKVSDLYGNIATSHNQAGITLAIAQGEGMLLPQSALESPAVNGIVQWSGVTYNGSDSFSLKAFGTGLEPAQGDLIAVVNDPTTVVLPPTSQPLGGSIPSTLTQPGQAIEVLKFTISDAGLNDGLPTYVQQMVVKRPSGMASFSTHIAGVVIRVNGQIASVGNPQILAASITIPVPMGAITIPDGQSVEVSIAVYLKGSGLVHGAQLGFMVDSNDHGFVAYEEGSTFAPVFPETVSSNIFTVDVEAVGLRFTSVPGRVGLNEEFSVEVSAVDANGNVDTDAMGTVVLSKNSGTGTLTIPSAQGALVDGKYQWEGLAYDKAEPFTLLASSPQLDDVISPLIYCSDATSTLVQPVTQPADGTLSALAVSPPQAVEVFRFGVADLGTTDGLPTYITRMVFKSFGLPTNRPLNEMIGGVSLWRDDIELHIESVSVDAQGITLNFQTGDVVVNDNETRQFSLKVYLKEGGQHHGSTLCLHVSAASHGWQTSLLGSAFATVFETGIVGPAFTIEVEATSVAFVQQPFIATPDQAVTLAVAAVDEFLNVDRDAVGQVELKLASGPAGFTGGTSPLAFSNGVAVWDDIVLTHEGQYLFMSLSPFGYEAVLSQTIWIGNPLDYILKEDFEDGYPQSFPPSTHWAVSTVSPIEGNSSLKHALSGVAGQSSLPIPLGVENLNEGPMQWSFNMRNGNWDPTGDNAFWFVLVSDSESITMGEYSGYAVGVNLSGTTDLLTLWHVDKTTGAKPLIISSFDWDEAETVEVKVTRTPKGEWALWHRSLGVDAYDRLAGSAVHLGVTIPVTCGPVFKYTSTRAGELWVDNLHVSTLGYPPVIQSANLLNLSAVTVKFSSEIELQGALNPSNYHIKDMGGNTFSVLEVYPHRDNPAQFSLRTQELPLEPLTLYAQGMVSVTSGKMVNDSAPIGVGAAGNFGNLVINEIMARPSGTSGLPNVEYVELYNRTSETINLTDWKLTGGSRVGTITQGEIEPYGYAILSGSSGQEALSPYGNAISVTSFPSLLVGGMFLGLNDAQGNLISWVEYSDSWYRDDSKKAGGYSLERIDPDNLVEGAPNWIASNDPSGGTPGRENSVRASNPDRTSPRVVEIVVQDAEHITVVYSEVMDSLSITSPQAYNLSNGVGQPQWVTTYGPKYQRVELTLNKPLVMGEIYDLCFSETITDFSGNPLVDNCLKVAIPQSPQPGDVVINEVLFNPYAGGVDFVEIYNRSDKAIDLRDLKIANRHRETLEVNEVYAAADSAQLLLPHGYAVLSENPSLVSLFYHVENPQAMVWLKKLPSYPNDDGYVVLLGDNGIIDELRYDKGMHNKLLSDPKGVSLERINPELPAYEPSSWQSAAQTAGFATPTMRNSQYTDAIEAEDEFSLSHEIFSPDGDGFEDILLINYQLPESGYIANILVFDSRGRRVRRLANNLLLGTEGSVQWDGTNDEGRRVSLGAYVVFIEAFDLKGQLKRYKKTVVVATRLR